MLAGLMIVIPPILANLSNILGTSVEARADEIAEEFALAIDRGTTSIEPFRLAPDQFAIQLRFDQGCTPFIEELYRNGAVLPGSQMGSECPGNVCLCIGTFNNVGCEDLEICSPSPYGSPRCDSRTCVLNWSGTAPSWVPILESSLENVSARRKVIYKLSADPSATLSTLCSAFFAGAWERRPNITLINCGRIGEGTYITVNDGSCSGGCENNLFLWVRPNSQIGTSGATGYPTEGVIKTDFEVIR